MANSIQKTWLDSTLETQRRSCKLRDHSFSTYAKFSEKLTFLNPRHAHVSARIRG